MVANHGGDFIARTRVNRIVGIDLIEQTIHFTLGKAQHGLKAWAQGDKGGDIEAGG